MGNWDWSLALKWYESTGRDPDKLIDDVEGQIDWMIHEFTNIPTNNLDRPILPNGYRFSLKIGEILLMILWN